jgi:hypothetical protein
MAFGNDVSVYVEDKAGDLGAPGSPAPWWLSPDVDIPAHTGEAVQGANQVQVRVHTHEEPILDEKVVAEVYVGKPSLVLSPTTGTKRIDPGTLVFRPPNIPGPEPAAGEAGATLTFPWTPSGLPADVDGPGHRCLIVRAFPVSVAPPSSPFDVPNEQHEAQHNIEVLTTTNASGNMAHAGAGTPHDPRRRDKATGLWWEQFATMGAKRRGKHFVVWAFDPEPNRQLVGSLSGPLKKAGCSGFSDRPPDKITLEPIKTTGEQIDPTELLENREFAERAGLGKGLFAGDRLLGAASLDLGPRKLAGLLLRFNLLNLPERTAAVMHGAQWNAQGEPEGGITLVALAPV